MCVDDYQFRHYSAKRQKICRRFIFRTQQGDERVFLVNISQFQRHGQLCLCEILMHLNKKGLNIKDYSFYMPQYDIKIEAGDRCKVPFDIMQFKQVIFQMKPFEPEQNDQNIHHAYFVNGQHQNSMDIQTNKIYQKCLQCENWKPNSEVDNSNNKEDKQAEEEIYVDSQEQKVSHLEQQYVNPSYGIKIKQLKNGIQNKKQKQQQKTVYQALYKTKMWRMLHQKCNFSLKNAATYVELSKKTLDDYFLVIRVAEFHGYDFKSNLAKKIGHLRAFIRKQPVKVSGRLPKYVKNFNLVPDPDLSKIMPISDWSKSEHIQQESRTQNYTSQNQNNSHQMIAQ